MKIYSRSVQVPNHLVAISNSVHPRRGSRISARGGRQGIDDLIWDGDERFLTYSNTDLQLLKIFIAILGMLEWCWTTIQGTVSLLSALETVGAAVPLSDRFRRKIHCTKLFYFLLARKSPLYTSRLTPHHIERTLTSVPCDQLPSPRKINRGNQTNHLTQISRRNRQTNEVK